MNPDTHKIIMGLGFAQVDKDEGVYRHPRLPYQIDFRGAKPDQIPQRIADGSEAHTTSHWQSQARKLFGLR